MGKRKEKREKKGGILNSFSINYLNPKTLYTAMRIPTTSLNESIMAYYIEQWAKTNNVDFAIDNIGNITLTKGELAEGEFYPCVTAHQDTVQYNSSNLIAKAQLMPMKIRVRQSDGNHILFCEGCGIGADDKAGITICLSLFEKFDKLKAFFPVAEELGCWGTDYFFDSKNKSFFDNVGYVVGFDSPEFNRSAWASNGVKLFNKEWFEANLKEVAASNNVTSFRQEPYTDVYMIRQKTNLVCMNFGNGGHYAHSEREYLNIEECDLACKLGIDVITSLGNTKHELEVELLKSTKDSDFKYFTDYVKENGGIKGDWEPEELNGTMNINDFQTMRTKLFLKLQMMGVDLKELEECFDWSCGNWDHYISRKLLGNDAIEEPTTEETVEEVSEDVKEESVETVTVEAEV